MDETVCLWVSLLCRTLHLALAKGLRYKLYASLNTCVSQKGPKAFQLIFHMPCSGLWVSLHRWHLGVHALLSIWREKRGLFSNQLWLPIFARHTLCSVLSHITWYQGKSQPLMINHSPRVLPSQDSFLLAASAHCFPDPCYLVLFNPWQLCLKACSCIILVCENNPEP